MMRKILIFCLIFMSININAQVTIGSGNSPNIGALLDLKQSQSEDANSKKGLLLPRVKLSDKELLDITGGVTGLDVEVHIGLMVYNLERKDANEGVTDRNDMLCPGVHVWSGTTWMPLKKYPARGLMCDGSDPGEFTQCGDPLRDMEDNEYATGLFGGAGCWITKNLKSTKNANVNLTEGTNASNALGLLNFTKPNTTAQDAAYGYLYTWEAAMGGNAAEETLMSADTSQKTSTIQGICPTGWVVPNDFDWNKLEEELATKPNLYSDLAAPSQAWQASYSTTLDWRPFVSGTNINKGWGQSFRSKTLVNNAAHTYPSLSKEAAANGFDALLVGTLQSGAGQGFGDYSGIWSSNDVFTPIGGDDSANYRGLWHGNNGVYRGSASKSSMLSVRCKLAE